MGRVPTCVCGKCKKCKNREYQRNYMRDYVKGERRSHKFKRAKIEIDKPQTVGKVNLSSVQEKSRTLSRKVSRDEPDDEGQESVLP